MKRQTGLQRPSQLRDASGRFCKPDLPVTADDRARWAATCGQWTPAIKAARLAELQRRRTQTAPEAPEAVEVRLECVPDVSGVPGRGFEIALAVVFAVALALLGLASFEMCVAHVGR